MKKIFGLIFGIVAILVIVSCGSKSKSSPERIKAFKALVKKFELAKLPFSAQIPESSETIDNSDSALDSVTVAEFFRLDSAETPDILGLYTFVPLKRFETESKQQLLLVWKRGQAGNNEEYFILYSFNDQAESAGTLTIAENSAGGGYGRSVKSIISESFDISMTETEFSGGYFVEGPSSNSEKKRLFSISANGQITERTK